jgi:hypothetical protein
MYIFRGALKKSTIYIGDTGAYSVWPFLMDIPKISVRTESIRIVFLCDCRTNLYPLVNAPLV